MDWVSVAEILTDAGYVVIGSNSTSFVVEDPTCILRAFTDFIDFAWLLLGALAAILLFGWGIALIRGASMDIRENMRNLFLLFGCLAAAPAIISFLVGEGILECKHIEVSFSEISKTLALKDLKFEADTVENIGFERFKPFRNGTINEHNLTDVRLALDDADVQNIGRVIEIYRLRIRGCERAGCGHIGAPRAPDSGPPEHEGTDIVSYVGAPVPALLSGRITDIEHRANGLHAITVLNDNDTTSYYLYVEVNNLEVGAQVNAGDIIGYSQDITMYEVYEDVPNHWHFELWSGPNRQAGDIISIEALF